MSSSFTSSDISPSNAKNEENLTTQSSTSLLLLEHTKNQSHMTSFRELASSSCESQLCSASMSANSPILFLKNYLELRGSINGE